MKIIRVRHNCVHAIRHINIRHVGPWVIFRQYLTVRPWSLGFLVEQNGIDTQVVWVRLPGLSEGYYTSFILKAIGQVTGSVIKINGNTVHAKIGRFAHMTICVDLKKPLLSKKKD
uniref:Uncharacterized protein n=1 Tax=Gossypium raimondii TaxID=29730 RepID=A0A0D2TJS9_GOSRA|nr:hypothetical protein B456_007G226400 [Gossypium raimondii]